MSEELLNFNQLIENLEGQEESPFRSWWIGTEITSSAWSAGTSVKS